MSSLANEAFHGRDDYDHPIPLHTSDDMAVSAGVSGMLPDEVMTSLKLASLEENADYCMRVEFRIT